MGPEAVAAAQLRMREQSDEYQAHVRQVCPNLGSIYAPLPPLQKISKAYQEMSELIKKFPKRILDLYSKKIVSAMEEFILSKASEKAKEPADSANLKELPEGTLSDLNVRFPKLRAPAFQTCIENVLSSTKDFHENLVKTDELIGRIGEITNEFIGYGNNLSQ